MQLFSEENPSCKELFSFSADKKKPNKNKNSVQPSPAFVVEEIFVSALIRLM